MGTKKIRLKIGDRIGKLEIIETWTHCFYGNRKQRVCKCKCDCGNIIELRATNIQNFGRICCGCTQTSQGKKDKFKIGSKWGKLTVINRWSEEFTNHKESVCECLCDCGKTIVLRGRLLLKKEPACDACWRLPSNHDHKLWQGYGEISSTVWKTIYKGRVRSKRILDFTVTIEEAWNLFLEQDKKCAISGLPIQFARSAKNSEDHPKTASLDRIDSSKGYISGNIQWVHKDVQKIKMDLSEIRFFELCRLVVENMEAK